MRGYTPVLIAVLSAVTGTTCGTNTADAATCSGTKGSVMQWTREMLETLDRMWLEGTKAAEIGQEVGVSPSAVVGMVHRRPHLPKRKSPIIGDQEAIQKKREATKAAKRNGEAPGYRNRRSPERSRAKPPPVAVIILPRVTTCSWPIGELRSKDFHYCGAKTQPGKPYCPEHCKTAYVRVKDRREE